MGVKQNDGVMIRRESQPHSTILQALAVASGSASRFACEIPNEAHQMNGIPPVRAYVPDASGAIRR
jgi:hypothetical protein